MMKAVDLAESYVRGESIGQNLQEKHMDHDGNFRNVRGLPQNVARLLDKVFKQSHFSVRTVAPYKKGGCRIKCDFDRDESVFKRKGEMEHDIDTALGSHGYNVNTSVPSTKDRVTFELTKPE